MRASRVVLDTNVLISASIQPRGLPAQCLFWIYDNAELIASEQLLTEFESRLARPKFAKYISESQRHSVFQDVVRVALLVQLTGTLKACRDPDDDAILETALRGEADFLVTGDKDLLVLHPFQGIPIVSPQVFLAAVAGQSP